MFEIIDCEIQFYGIMSMYPVIIKKKIEISVRRRAGLKEINLAPPPGLNSGPLMPA